MDGSVQHKAHAIFPRQTFPIPALYCVKFLTLQKGDYHSLKLLLWYKPSATSLILQECSIAAHRALPAACWPLKDQKWSRKSECDQCPVILLIVSLLLMPIILQAPHIYSKVFYCARQSGYEKPINQLTDRQWRLCSKKMIMKYLVKCTAAFWITYSYDISTPLVCPLKYNNIG